MGFYADQVLPRLTDFALGSAQLRALRARVCAPLKGDVLEIGFGTGRNVPHYGPLVTSVRAVDPAVVGRRLAAGRVEASAVPVHYVGLDGQDLPLDDQSVDDVLMTWTLCSIPDPRRALSEIKRVLRPGGGVHLVEHGRAPDPGVLRWQERLTPLQRRVFGGCHLDRDVAELVEAAGFTWANLERYYLGPRSPFTFMYEGVARPMTAGDFPVST